MKTGGLGKGLAGLRDEDPKRFISLVRLLWPDVKAALERGHSIKTVHERVVSGGLSISYRLFTMYVGQLRREQPSLQPSASQQLKVDSLADEQTADSGLALVRVAKRRLFSAKAAAHYLGIGDRTLKNLVDRGELDARAVGRRCVFRLEDLDAYIESLPKLRRAV